ncbi:MAG: hypothetical protein LBN27_05145 [Prevotellaceae bacterium]|jgi:hypothetical protein|nr:hypothetical protein [Prevotellaceae bacterium]
MALNANQIAGIVEGGIGFSMATVGAIMEQQQRKKMEKQLRQRQNEVENWYNKEYNSDYMQRADIQNVVRAMRNSQKEDNEELRSRAVIAGATPGAEAATRERSAKAMAGLYGNIAAQGQLHKDSIQDKYYARKEPLYNMLYQNMADKANNYNNLMYNGLKLGGNSFNTFVGQGSDTSGIGKNASPMGGGGGGGGAAG